MVEVVKGKGGWWCWGEAVGKRGAAAGKGGGVESGIGRKPVLRAPRGLSDGGHATHKGGLIEGVIRGYMGRCRRTGVG